VKQRNNHMLRNRLSRGINQTFAVLLLAGGFSASACSSDGDDRPPPAPAATASTTPDAGLSLTSSQGCIDQDGDSFGLGCTMGPDCDDQDPAVTSECLCTDQDSPGCACSNEGAEMACGKVYSRVGDQVVCGDGVSTCDGNVWGECIINGAVTIKSTTSLLRPMSLGAPSACAANPCDPKCQTFTDTTTGLSLASDTGVVATASGVTLPGSEAIVVPGVNSAGYDCTDTVYPPSGGCAHHVCRTGTALNQWCDGVAPVQVPLTIFTDDFSGTTGWTLGSNWAIGSATASSGQSSGNADPAADTSTTSDNRIAGTVIGGNLGGPVTLFSDAFASNWSSSGYWSETGHGDWTTKSRYNTSGSASYPATASGNPVAHSDSCVSTGPCVLTLTSGLNLSTYSSATLNFLYYLDENLDTGEYLKAEAYNGSTWTQIMNKVSEADDDSVWHAFSLPLTSYMVNGFKVRFTTVQNAADEAVELDDVNVTAQPPSTTSYFTSPVFNTAASVGNVTLSFKRWLNVNAEFVAKLEIYDGASWVALYTSSGAVSDSSWQSQAYNITSYKSASTQLRFSYTGTSANKVSGWNIDDLQVVGTQWTAGTSLCVSKICQSKPACCTTAWTIDCVDALANVCQVECAVDTGHNNNCIACFHDPTLTVDVDGDGQSPATGDCRECDPGISAGAYDLPGDHIDQNCDGTADNEVTSCDTGLAAAGDANAHAKALGLCKVASGNSWGVVSASFVRADGVTACTDAKQYEIMGNFGSGNLPVEGAKMAAYSSGTARMPSESGYVQPNGVGYNANTSSTPKYAIPSASGCSAGQAGYDSCGLKLVIKAPTNANSFGYNFNFFTSEYPEWLCTSYNDSYAAYYEGSLNTQVNKNISFDSASNPVSVNNGLFSIPGGWPPLATGLHPLLNGTGFDGVCANPFGSKYTSPSICGGSTGWLQTTAPVKPGEQITLTFNVWDTGDHQWDSTVLLDRFTWSTAGASIQTGHFNPGSSSTIIPPSYTPGTFTRDYDMTGVCGSDFLPVWSLWSWSATTPGDSKIEFYVQAADTTAGLATAPSDALLFSTSTGPSALVGQPAVAKAGTPNTQTGSVVVYDTLKAKNRLLSANHVRITARLVPTTDLLQTPTLGSWNLQTSCQAAQ
jgi:hypothetical protein